MRCNALFMANSLVSTPILALGKPTCGTHHTTDSGIAALGGGAVGVWSIEFVVQGLDADP